MAFLGGLFGGGPSPPDPYQQAAGQFGYNQEAAQRQQMMNMIGQQTPYGSLSWNRDPNAPGGFTATQTLTPAQQQLLQQQQALQGTLGGAAQGLGGQLSGLYGQPANLDTSSLTNQLMDWQTQSMQPYWDIQKSNLQSSLQEQGLSPNDAAWQNAMMAFTKGIGQARNQMFAQAEPLAFGQAVQKYQLPMQTEQGLVGMFRGPTGPSFVNTPQEQIQPPNLMGAQQQAYQNQMERYQNQMQGVGQLLGAAGGMFGNLPIGSFAGGWGAGGGASPMVLGGSF